MELYDFNSESSSNFKEEFQQPEGIQYEHTKKEIDGKFVGISKVLRLNCIFWFIVCCIPQLLVGYTIGFIFVSNCYPLTIWVVVYTSINLLEPVFVGFFFFFQYRFLSVCSRIFAILFFILKLGIVIWGGIWLGFFYSKTCIILWDLQITLVAVGLVSLIFSPCNFLIVCFRESNFLSAKNGPYDVKNVPEWD
jgi:hypothetical protein